MTVLRELFRHLSAFRAVYETDGVDTIIGPGGDEFCLWDLEYLYEQLVDLPPRQRQAIELCLVANVKESVAAVMMGVSPTNPVAMYATSGLEKLVRFVEEGGLHRAIANSAPQRTAVAGQSVPARGRIFCRTCTFSATYDGRQGFIAAVRQLRDHQETEGPVDHAVA